MSRPVAVWHGQAERDDPTRRRTDDQIEDVRDAAWRQPSLQIDEHRGRDDPSDPATVDREHPEGGGHCPILPPH